MAVKSQPEGYHTVTPYLAVPRVADMLEFLQEVFGAEQAERLERPDRTIYHAEVRIGDSTVMMGEPTEEGEQSPGTMYVYVKDTDAVYKRALAAGATSVMEPADMFYGDRNAGVMDAFGNRWWIATHIEDLSSEEIQRRSAERMREQG